MHKMRYFVGLLVCIALLAGCISVNRVPHRAYNYAKSHNVVFDAIIVPGVPFEDASLDSVMKARVIWAYVLYKHGMTRNIIFSGAAVYSPYYEAKIMGLYAQSLGIPAKHIFYDTVARHSTENVYYSYLIAKQQGFKVIALTTDPFQSALLRKYTKTRFGTVMYHMPFVIDSVRKYNHMKYEIDPSSARCNDFKSITEAESRSERFLGTLGGNINWKKHKGRKLPPL